MNIGATLIGQACWFLLFVWITMKYVWPPLKKAMDERAGKIAEGLAAADRAKLDLEQASKRSAEELAVARREAAELIAKGEQRAAAIVEEARQVAKQEGDRILAGARSEIDQEVERAKAGLRDQVAALAVAGAEKILRREVDAKVHAELLSGLASEL
ncbi:MAG: F0F1 ATP synthase subunit B [Burkholderiaceae bacterium]